MVKPQVLWERKSDLAEQEALPHKYIFVIVNEAKKIVDIKQEIFEQLAVVSELSEICKYPVKSEHDSHHRLHCDAFSFFSNNSLDIRLYGKGWCRRDSNLYTRKRGELSDYIESIIPPAA